MRIRIVAPSGPVDEKALDAGIEVLTEKGWRVTEGIHVRNRTGYLAGSDEDRLADLQEALDDSDADAVWFARGGYGVTRLLGRLSREGLEARPKTVAGFSDATALHAWASDVPGVELLYAPSVQELGRPGVCELESLWAALNGKPAAIPAGAGPGGRVGPFPVAGGCLTLLSVLCGTPWSPELRGRWLFIEEVGEQLYRIDRMLTHLASAGWLEACSGVLLGAFTGMGEEETPSDVLERVRDILPSLTPVVSGLPVGHLKGKHTLPLGRPALWDGGRLIFP